MLTPLSDSDDDAFWLAQVHFASGNYSRAYTFLTNHDLISRNAACRYLAGNCLFKQARYDEALVVLGEHTPAHLLDPHRRVAGVANRHRRGPLFESGGGMMPPSPSKRNRGLAKGANGKTATSALSMIVSGGMDYEMGGTQDDNEVVLENSQLADESADEAVQRKCEAAMCNLRGRCYAKNNSFDRAKECYKDAVRIDVQCFDAFNELMKSSLLSPEEEWQFLDTLDFDSVQVMVPSAASTSVMIVDQAASQEAAEFTRMLYTTRLSKYKYSDTFDSVYGSLSTHYGLADNADLLLSRADVYYTQCKHRDALAITSRLLATDKHNFAAYPIHLACMYELGMRNQLYLTAHELADEHPDQPCTWLAVGTYYFAIHKIVPARRFFSKASMMDAHFGPAWIGFAHTFASEGEHDQAISAYSQAARLFKGTHVPQLFLGMEHISLNNTTLAEEFLRTAWALCRTDPLLLNELGVVKYHQNMQEDAITMFKMALQMAEEMDSEPHSWITVRTNLGHAYRRYGHLNRALSEYDEVLRLGGKDSAVFAAKGLVLMELGRPADAVVVLHESLALAPQNGLATELLSKCLGETLEVEPITSILYGHENGFNHQMLGAAEVMQETAALDAALGEKLADAAQNMRVRVSKGVARPGRKGSASGGEGNVKGKASTRKPRRVDA